MALLVTSYFMTSGIMASQRWTHGPRKKQISEGGGVFKLTTALLWLFKVIVCAF